MKTSLLLACARMCVAALGASAELGSNESPWSGKRVGKVGQFRGRGEGTCLFISMFCIVTEGYYTFILFLYVLIPRCSQTWQLNFPICKTICFHFRFRKGFSPAIQGHYGPLMFFTEAGAHLIKKAHGACSFLSGTLIFRRIPTCRGDLAGWPLKKYWLLDGVQLHPAYSEIGCGSTLFAPLDSGRKKAEGISKTPSTLLFAAFSYGSAGFQAGYIHTGYANDFLKQVQTFGPLNELSHKIPVLDSFSTFFWRGALP